jgi:hypothetical protein
MLLSTKRFQGARALARDGYGGQVEDVYFDDVAWQVRYLVLREDDRMPPREHLVRAQAIEPPASARDIRLALSRDEIAHCPEIDEDPPVSHQFDIGREPYYGTPTFLTWGRRALSDPHLRSAMVVIGYVVQAQNGPFGHVADLILDSDGWAIRTLVVDGGGWLPGKSAFVPASAVERIDWAGRQVCLHMTRAQIGTARRSSIGTFA